MVEVGELIQATLKSRVSPEVRVIDVRQRERGTQGFSQVTLHYYDVVYEQTGVPTQIALVIKEVAPVERLTLEWLGERRLSVPFSFALDTGGDGTTLLCMQYVGEAPALADRTQRAAQALAAIHHAALGRRDNLLWLPPADPTFFAERIIDACWRRAWRYVLSGEGYIDWYGRWHEPRAPDPFWQQFAEYDRPLEEAAARFLRDMTTLWQQGDILTLLHADFHSDNVRADDGRIYVIDWEQACYGPLYIDLPNYFTREESLLYRDALAVLGCDIPADTFLAHYDAASRYIGFKYFGFGVLSQRPDGPPRRREDALYWIEMALNGTSGGRPVSEGSSSP